MAAAYYIRKRGHEVTLYEAAPVLGGLAVGFKSPGWDWYLERAYHHLFANDYDILNFARDTGFDGVFFSSPETASLYENRKKQETSNKQISNNKYQITKLDTPLDLLRFPYLNIFEKIRAGAVLAFLKFVPFLKIYEEYSAEDFLKKYMGHRAYEVLFAELMRKKLGKYAGKILMSFFWARITKRTKSLGYIRGGFQTFIDHIEKDLRFKNIDLRIGNPVSGISKKGGKFFIDGEEYDAVVSTLPSALLPKVAGEIFPQKYLERFKRLKFLHAIVLILETKEKFLDKSYWLNLCTDKIPAMVAVQHTNFVDKKHYGGHEILYVANYVDNESPLLKMSDEEIENHYLKQLRQITNNKLQITRSFVFKGSFAQPIFDRDFLKNKPDFITPVKNFYIANLDMTYPYDRGTNYAVKLGRKVAELIKYSYG